MHPRLFTPDRLIWLVSLCLATTGVLLWWPGVALPELGPAQWWPLLALLFGLTERFAVHVPFGRDNHGLTLSQAPLVLGLFFLPAQELLLAAVGGAVLLNVVLQRRSAIKAVFNVASTTAQATAASLVFSALVTPGSAAAGTVAVSTWVAALAATLVADVLANVALFTIISLRQGQRDWPGLARTLVAAVIGTIVVTDLALVTVVVLRVAPAAFVLLAVLGLLSFLLYRGYQVQRLRYARLELLYRFTGSVDRALKDGTVLETVRAEACELVRARDASVVICQPNADTWWAGACEGRSVLLPRGGTSREHELLRLDGHVDGMAAPLRDGGEITGVFLVTGRLDDMSTFDQDDLRLFEALAAHASVALINSGLVARVRAAAEETEHLSLHDPLTGLPNRLHFHQRLERRLLRDGSAAVLLMDVDRFKEVNDTLGHDVGDRLLREVGRRLRLIGRGETVAARLGGDEFAVLLAGDDVHIEGMVARITRDMSRPFDLGEVTVDMTASIGIAASPHDGASAALLLRRAEVAMYDAKHGHTGVAHYAVDRDPYSSRRLSLIGDLSRALADGRLEVHYQPQASPASGQVTGVEALLRWNHPVWGNVAPDEFIPLAEQTGLIRQLTHHVLATAVRQSVQWRDAGTPVVIAVNISVRNLLEPELADSIARLLVQAGLSAGMLKLEVTEGAIVSDPERAVRAIERLADLGLVLSVDDFGTGYSSLTRLRALPVHEVKIDRSFVLNLAEHSDDQAIVRAVINLGHDLGLRVVAEGVEDEDAWQLLNELGCDLVQGYFLARPMAAAAMTSWLAEHHASFTTRLHGQAPTAGGPEPDDLPAVRRIR